MSKLIIALSGKSGSGKTTAAELIKHMCNEKGLKCTLLSFAEPVKRIARDLFAWDGDKMTYAGEHAIDKTKGRGLLIAVGDALRSIDPRVFINAIIRAVQDGEAGVYVVDDLRLKGEALSLQGAFGPAVLALRLTRLVPKIDDHTETELDGFEGFNAEIDNSGDMVSLIEKLTQVLKEANDAADKK